MYPKHRLAYTKEISGEIDFKCRNMQKYFPNSGHVWVVDMKKIEKIDPGEICQYLHKEIIYIFGNKKLHFTV